MFCRSCGNEINQGVRFCTSCGTETMPGQANTTNGQSINNHVSDVSFDPFALAVFIIRTLAIIVGTKWCINVWDSYNELQTEIEQVSALANSSLGQALQGLELGSIAKTEAELEFKKAAKDLLVSFIFDLALLFFGLFAGFFSEKLVFRSFGWGSYHSSSGIISSSSNVEKSGRESNSETMGRKSNPIAPILIGVAFVIIIIAIVSFNSSLGPTPTTSQGNNYRSNSDESRSSSNSQTYSQLTPFESQAQQPAEEFPNPKPAATDAKSYIIQHEGVYSDWGHGIDAILSSSACPDQANYPGYNGWGGTQIPRERAPNPEQYWSDGSSGKVYTQIGCWVYLDQETIRLSITRKKDMKRTDVDIKLYDGTWHPFK